MLPAFHREQLAASTAIMAEEAERAVDGWSAGARVDLYAWTRRLALRVAMRALFGFDPDSSARDAEMAAQFEEALGFWGKDYALQMLRGPGSPWRTMNRAREQLDRVIFAEIARRRASGERGVDILSLLLDAEDEDGARLSDQQLRDQVMTLLFAGHDTTTSTVTFLFFELARNPEEIAALDEDDRLEMAIDETLRLYPPAWIGPRRNIEAFELHGIHVPAGVNVNYCSWASHHLPEVFPEPERFRPSRFAPDARAALPEGRLRAVRRGLAHLHRDALRAAGDQGDRARDPAPLHARARGARPPGVDPADADAVAARRAAGGGTRATLRRPRRAMGGAWLEQATSTL